MSVRQNPRPSARLVSMVEALEARQLLHAGHPEVIGTTLVIEGLEGRDRIDVKLVDNKKTFSVTFNGVTETIQARRVAAIRVLGQGGKDRITLKGTMGRLPVTLSGGAGSDLITGNRDNEIINGDGGRDTISGGSGNDRIKGGGSDDLILGGLGNDNIGGGSGNDALYGDAGNDKLFGDDGNDTLGGDDEDSLVIPTAATDVFGNDLLDGGDGADHLLGGIATYAGSQQLVIDNNGRDTFTGGNGPDILNVRDSNDRITDQTGQDFVPINQFTPVLPDPHSRVHSHANLTIRIFGQTVVVPNSVGSFPSGLAASHTHNEATNGRIHFEGDLAAGYTLEDFFTLWGVSFSETHVGRFFNNSQATLSMRVNGQSSTAFENLVPPHATTAAGEDTILIEYGA